MNLDYANFTPWASLPVGVLVLQGYTPQQLEFRMGCLPLLSHLYTEELLRAAFSRPRQSVATG